MLYSHCLVLYIVFVGSNFNKFGEKNTEFQISNQDPQSARENTLLSKEGKIS